jgi:hypothetical protein
MVSVCIIVWIIGTQHYGHERPPGWVLTDAEPLLACRKTSPRRRSGDWILGLEIIVWLGYWTMDTTSIGVMALCIMPSKGIENNDVSEYMCIGGGADQINNLKLKARCSSSSAITTVTHPTGSPEAPHLLLLPHQSATPPSHAHTPRTVALSRTKSCMRTSTPNNLQPNPSYLIGDHSVVVRITR